MFEAVECSKFVCLASLSCLIMYICCRRLPVSETRGFCHHCCRGSELARHLRRAMCSWNPVLEILHGTRTHHWGHLREPSQTCRWTCGRSYRQKCLPIVQCPWSTHCRYVAASATLTTSFFSWTLNMNRLLLTTNRKPYTLVPF